MGADIKISIITPLYNSERFIDGFVSCFLNQILDRVELLLIDDASPDNGLNKALHYEKLYPGRIRVFHNDINRGAGGARNHGLKNARGDYVCFFDPDDWMDKTMLYKLYDVALKEQCDVVDCDYYNYLEDKDLYFKETSLQDECIGDITDRNINILVFASGRIFTKIFRKDMLIDNGLCYPENIRFEDNGVNFCICAKKIGKVKEHLFYYRTNSSSSQTGSMFKTDYVLDRVRAAEHLVLQFIKLDKFNIAFEGLEYRFVHIGYASNIRCYIAADYEINFEVLKYAKELAYKYFKDFKRNVYYRKFMPLSSKLVVILYELNPKLIYIYKKFRPIIKLRHKVIEFLKGIST